MKSLNRLFPYLRRYRHLILLGFVFVTISNICSTYLPRIIGEAVDHLSRQDLTMDFVYSRIWWVIGLTFGSGLFMYLTRRTIIYASRLIEYDLRYDLMNAIIYQPIEFFHKHPVGSLMAYTTNDVPAAREFLGPAIMYGANTVTTFGFAFYFMFTLNPEITLISILPLPIITIATYFIGKKIHIASKDVQNQFSDLTNQAQEAISGIRIVRSYNREDYEQSVFATLSEDYLKKNLRLARIQSLFMPALSLLVGFSIVIVLAYGGKKVIDGTASIGELTQFFIYLTLLIWPVAAIGWITNIIQRAAASAARLGELFDKMPDANSVSNSTGISDIPNEDIVFENVSLKYDGSEKESLSDINLRIPSGSSLGIIGSVGSGKSSLVNLLPRLYEPNKGRILIGETPLSEFSLSALRQVISFVPQDTFLFSMSIEDNIKFSKPNAGMAEIENAARLAELEQEILSFTDRYSTMLGERGITLSGGQKQRVAIARALLRQPEILILDDSLSAIDASTEEKILKNLRELIKKQTTIIISHRLSSVRNADNIIVLDEGRIVEQGKHDELIALGGYYSNIYSKQVIEEELLEF